MKVTDVDQQYAGGGVQTTAYEQGSLLSQLDIIKELPGGLVECWAPMDLIDYEEVAVDVDHAMSLAQNMDLVAEKRGGSGQLAAVTCGIIPGEDKLKIVDGFHRDYGMRINGKTRERVLAMETDWDELYDNRIFTAKEHVHVRFSRVVQWIQEVWQFSGLSDKLSVDQAFLLYNSDTNGVRLGLDPTEVDAVKAWAGKKERQWGINAMTIRSNLLVAETVDSKLIHSTREKTDSSKLTAPTQAILKIFSDVLPHKLEIQNLVMTAAMEHNLKGPVVNTLCRMVSECETPEEVQAVISNVDLNTLESYRSKDTKKGLRRTHDPRHKGAAVLDKAGIEIESAIQRAQQSLDQGEEVTYEMRARIEAAQLRSKELIGLLGDFGIKLANLASSYQPSQPNQPTERPKERKAATAQTSSKKTTISPTPAADIVQQTAKDDDRELPPARIARERKLPPAKPKRYSSPVQPRTLRTPYAPPKSEVAEPKQELTKSVIGYFFEAEMMPVIHSIEEADRVDKAISLVEKRKVSEPIARKITRLKQETARVRSTIGNKST